MTGEGGLLRFVLKRLAVAIPLLLLISFIVFSLVKLAPGDPVRALLGAKPATEATLDAIRDRYNLNDPYLLQYGKWIWGVLHGDLGRSIQGDRRISGIIASRMELTLFLATMSAAVILVGGIGLGALAAFRRNSWIDRALVMFGVIGISAPAYVFGIFLLYFFGVVLQWFPVFGDGEGFFDRFWHLVLPALALSFSVMAIIIKITRASMIEEMDKDYVTFARARGLSAGRISTNYILRNALVPVITAAGLILVGLVAGSIYVEVTFSLSGFGSLTFEAVAGRNLPLIQATALIFSVIVVAANLIIDIIYTLIDPRIRFGAAPK
ncbi:MAG: ABC transporter permease [Cucumibacter sp.]